MRGRIAAGAMLALALTAGGAGSAHAAIADDPYVIWDGTSATLEYGEYWTFSASADAPETLGPWTATGSISGAPSGYAATFSSYQSGSAAVYAYVAPGAGVRPLGAGSYTVTLVLTGASSPAMSPPAPATLTITPAALTMTLAVIADPSNPANAIVSGELTGAFRDNFFTSSFEEGPLSPAGVWKVEITDDQGETVLENTIDRADTDDAMGFSQYWPGVAPGAYTVRASFTPSGASAQNFSITQPSTVTYTAAPAPGATSTATPAPPAPPPVGPDAGMTLPAWIPLVAGVLSAGLIALLVVQIVRLRRVTAGLPATAEEPA